MIAVFHTHQAMEAQLVCGLLKSRGVHAQVFNQDTAALIGAGQAAVPATVRVAQDDEAQAKAILFEVMPQGEAGRMSLFESLTEAGRLSAGPEPEICPACSETWEPGFDVCWNCEHEWAPQATPSA